jgi:hypothetical protein
MKDIIATWFAVIMGFVCLMYLAFLFGEKRIKTDLELKILQSEKQTYSKKEILTILKN